MSIKLRTIELATYVKETKDEVGSGLYVVNTMKRNKGKILFSCMGELGKPSTVVIPATWIPVDLTEQAQREKLIDSTEFKSLLRKGVIAIVSETVTPEKKKLGFIGASEALKLPECAEEYKAVLAATGGTSVDTLQDDSALDLNSVRKGQEQGGSEREASDLALSIISREMSNESEDTLVNAFRTKLSEFDEADLRYIAENATGSTLKRLAVEALEGESDDDEESLSIG